MYKNKASCNFYGSAKNFYASEREKRRKSWPWACFLPFQASRGRFPRKQLSLFIVCSKREMFGEKAVQLIKDLNRSKNELLPAYKGDLVQAVFEEMTELFETARQNM